jgi:hypothetical protein
MLNRSTSTSKRSWCGSRLRSGSADMHIFFVATRRQSAFYWLTLRLSIFNGERLATLVSNAHSAITLRSTSASSSYRPIGFSCYMPCDLSPLTGQLSRSVSIGLKRRQATSVRLLLIMFSYSVGSVAFSYISYLHI